MNVVALISAFVGACILKESPLQPIQLLWVNLIMDSLGSLALATEPPTLELLKRKPQSRDEYIVSQKMVKHILGISIYQCILIFVIIFAGEKFIFDDSLKHSLYNNEADRVWQPSEEDANMIEDECKEYPALAILADPAKYLPGADFINKNRIFPGRRYDWNNDPIYKCYYEMMGPSRHLSVVFNVFVWMQVFNMINARKIHDEVNIFKGIHRNMLFILIWVIIAGFQFVIAQYTGKIFEVSPDGLNGQQWMISIVLGLGTFIIDLILKFVPDSLCPELGKKGSKDEPFEKKDGLVKKGSSTMHRRISQRIGSNSSR